MASSSASPVHNDQKRKASEILEALNPNHRRITPSHEVLSTNKVYIERCIKLQDLIEQEAERETTTAKIAAADAVIRCLNIEELQSNLSNSLKRIQDRKSATMKFYQGLITHLQTYNDFLTYEKQYTTHFEECQSATEAVKMEVQQSKEENIILQQVSQTILQQASQIALQQQIQTPQQVNQALQQANQTLQHENQTLQQQVQTFQPEIQALQQQIQTLQHESQALQQGNQTLEQGNQSLQRQIRTLHNRIDQGVLTFTRERLFLMNGTAYLAGKIKLFLNAGKVDDIPQLLKTVPPVLSSVVESRNGTISLYGGRIPPWVEQMRKAFLKEYTTYWQVIGVANVSVPSLPKTLSMDASEQLGQWRDDV